MHCTEREREREKRMTEVFRKKGVRGKQRERLEEQQEGDIIEGRFY